MSESNRSHTNGSESTSTFGYLRRPLTRRQALAGIGVLGAGLLLQGCGTIVKEPPKAPAGTGAATGASGSAAGGTAAQQVKLSLAGWNFQPEVVRGVLDAYEKQHPNVKVEFTAHASAQYAEKMLAVFMAKTPLDVAYGRDGTWPAWADAGYIQPVDGLPGLEEFVQDMIPFNLEGSRYKGKTWGLPYYGDFMSFGYDTQVLEKAGVRPPRTWDDMRQACQTIQKAGILETPLLVASGPTANLHWWTLVYGSGGNLFDADLEPVFGNGKDGTALALLEWLVDAAHTWKILDMKSVEATSDTSRQTFAAGRVAFATTPKFDLKYLNTPEKSKIAGRAKAMLVPTLAAGKEGTCGWTRIYCLSSTTVNKLEAWNLIKHLASPANAKNWYLKAGIGFAFKRLDSDPEIVASTKPWGDVELFTKQSATARARQAVNEPWFAEWENYNQQQIQNALLKKISPKDALAESAKKVAEVKKKFKRA